MQEDFKDCHQTLSAAGLVKVKWCKWHLFFGLNQKSKYGHRPPGLSKIIKVPTHGTGEPLWTAKSKMRVPEGAGLSTCWLCLAEHMREGGKNHYKTGRQCNRAGKLPWGGGRESREAEQLQDIKFSGKVGFNCCKKKTLCVYFCSVQGTSMMLVVSLGSLTSKQWKLPPGQISEQGLIRAVLVTALSL